MITLNKYQVTEPQSGIACDIALHEAGTPGKPVVFCVHGLTRNAKDFYPLAEVLAADYHVLMPDVPGRGESDWLELPDLYNNAMYASQLIALLQQQDIQKVHWIGTSMGGIIGTAYAIRHGDTLDGTILWNFNVDGGMLVSVLRAMLKVERALKGSDVPSALATKLTFEDWNRKFKPNRTDFDWLSRDESEVDKYVVDPLCGFACSVGLWLDVTAMIQLAASNRELASVQNKAMPVHLLGGQADPSSMEGKSMARLEARMKKSGFSNVALTLLADTRHETLNETNRDQVTANLISWLDQHWG